MNRKTSEAGSFPGVEASLGHSAVSTVHLETARFGRHNIERAFQRGVL
jgi:hypothetical protein